MSERLHGQEPAATWVTRWSHLVPAASTVLDIACGYGRHMRHFAALGHTVVGVDRNPEALAAVNALGKTVWADIENEAWPLAGQTYGGVIVTHYLWRPLWPHILASLAPDGVLIYETFTAGNETVGKPSRPDFLLRPGELLTVCKGVRVIAFEEGFLAQPDRFVQRIVAVNEPQAGSVPQRYTLMP